MTGEAGAAAAPLRLFFVCPPGLEPALLQEVRELGLSDAEAASGGVAARGRWPDLWRSHLWSRGATRILVRVAEARVTHLAQLDKWARRLPWADWLPRGATVRVEAVCRRSRLYHSGAVAERVATALSGSIDAGLSPQAEIRIVVRIERDLCEISLDASGAPLHQRGHKQAVGKAPLRETMAALLLRACGYRGDEPVLDPMCGSGTFVLEAAEIASGLAPGRGRGFAFERFAGFDRDAWAALKNDAAAKIRSPDAFFFGFDRDAGAIAASVANADRAGLAALTRFEQGPVSALAPPQGGRPGLVAVNPPYGERIGDKAALRALYGALGAVLNERFTGWRVGLITSEPTLARAAALPFKPPAPPIPHGALKIRLYQTDALA